MSGVVAGFQTMTSATGGAAMVAGAAALAAAGVVAHGVFSPRSGLFGSVHARCPRADVRAVALTFDDGPWPGSTDRVLDVLEGAGIAAAFFVIGRYAREHPDLVRRIHRSGHLLGNHTFDHSRTGMFRGWRYWNEQVRRTSDVLEEITGERPRMFRPPMGYKAPPLMRAAQVNGCAVVTWSRRAGDGVATEPARIVRNLGAMRAGEVLLLHDGRDPASRRPVGATAAALPRVIEIARERELECVRLDRLLSPPPLTA